MNGRATARRSGLPARAGARRGVTGPSRQGVVGQDAAQVRPQLAGGHPGAHRPGLEHDEGAHHLAPLRVGAADDDDLGHPGHVVEDGLLDQAGRRP